MAVILSSARPVTPCRCASKPRARLPTPRTQLPRNLETHLRRALFSLSSALAFVHGGRAGALTYEEALQQSTDTGGVDFSLPDVDLNGFLNFLTENPLVAFGGVAVVTVPLVVSQLFGGSKPYAVVSAKSAYDKLLNDPAVQLVDIRSVKDAREAGSPDLRAAKKKAVAVPYNGDDKNGFVKKLGLRFKDPEDTTLIILDKFDGNSELVAELVTANGFKAAFAVKDGAEGRRGWLKSNLPWTSKKGLSFNFGGWFTNAFGDSPDGLPLTVGLAAATGLGVFAYTEIETLLQIVGSAAILQLLANKLLYAESRKTTLKQVQEFFNTKVAPQELVDEIKAIGQALLPSSGDEKSPPAAAQATSTAATPAPEATTEVKAESTTEALASVNSAPVAAASSTDSAPSAPSRPLSPYPNYPDLKPPSSPSPSTP